MTPRQRAFCEHYAATGNGAESVRRAGYGHQHADIEAARLLAKPNIREYLTTLNQAAKNSRIADAIERQIFWTDIMRNADEKIETRLKASEILGKAHGDFVQRIEAVESASALTDAELDAKIESIAAELGYSKA